MWTDGCARYPRLHSIIKVMSRYARRPLIDRLVFICARAIEGTCLFASHDIDMTWDGIVASDVALGCVSCGYVSCGYVSCGYACGTAAPLTSVKERILAIGQWANCELGGPKIDELSGCGW